MPANEAAPLPALHSWKLRQLNSLFPKMVPKVTSHRYLQLMQVLCTQVVAEDGEHCGLLVREIQGLECVTKIIVYSSNISGYTYVGSHVKFLQVLKGGAQH